MDGRDLRTPVEIGKERQARRADPGRVAAGKSARRGRRITRTELDRALCVQKHGIHVSVYGDERAQPGPDLVFVGGVFRAALQIGDDPEGVEGVGGDGGAVVETLLPPVEDLPDLEVGDGAETDSGGPLDVDLALPEVLPSARR